MDGASFERVYDNFQDFHAFLAAFFGRKQWQERSRNYLRGLLVQAGERRNAGNLPEPVGIPARAMRGRAAPTKDAAPPAVKAGWSHHPKRVVVVLVM